MVLSLRFFQIPARGCSEGEGELNRFLCSHRVLAVDRRWVECGESSYWAICVDYLGGAEREATTSRTGKKSRVDYKEVLSPEEFELYAKLRDLRKSISTSEGVPVYAVLTNEQLATIAQTKPVSRTALEKVEGIGPARVKKYGEQILNELIQESGADATSEGTVSEDM